MPPEVICSTNLNCNDEAYHTMLCKLYNAIIKSLKDATEAKPATASITFSKHSVLDWNDLVRELKMMIGEENPWVIGGGAQKLKTANTKSRTEY